MSTTEQIPSPDSFSVAPVLAAPVSAPKNPYIEKIENFTKTTSESISTKWNKLNESKFKTKFFDIGYGYLMALGLVFLLIVIIIIAKEAFSIAGFSPLFQKQTTSRPVDHFATYADVVKNWGITPCGGASGTESFATYADVVADWGLTPCDVVDDPKTGLSDEDLANYNLDTKFLQSAYTNQLPLGSKGKESFAKYADVVSDWGLTPCDVIDDPKSG